MISNCTCKSFIKSSTQQCHLSLVRMESIFLHESQKVVSVQVALFVGVHALESVMDGEGVGAGDTLLGELDLFFGEEVSLVELEELVTSLISEVIFSWHLLHMDVLRLPLIYIMGIVWIFRSKRLTKV